MNLQFLFTDPITRMTELSPGYEDHASDVWWVVTEAREVVVREYDTIIEREVFAR